MKRLLLVLIPAFLTAAFWLGREPFSAELYARGLEAQKEWRLVEAKRLLWCAMLLGREEAQLELARTLEKGGDLTAARHLVGELLATARANPQLEARILAADAHHLYLSREAEPALRRSQQALEMARKANDRLLEGYLLRTSANIYSRYLGHLEEAQEHLEQALEISRGAGFEDLEADVLCDLGVFYWSYNRQRERPVPEFYTPALEIYERLNDRHGIARLRSLLGLVYLAQGSYEDSAREFEFSRATFETLGDPRGLGEIHSYLGAMYAGLENFPQAHQHYQKSLEIATVTGDGDAQRRLEPLLVDLEMRRGEFTYVVELLDHMISKAPDPSVVLRNHLTRRGHVLLHLDRNSEALASYQRALEVHQATPGSDEASRSQILTGLAHAHRRAGDHDEAEQALALAETIPLGNKGWDQAVFTLLARADLADARGEKEDALGYLLQAAEIESRTYGIADSHFYQTQYRQVFDRLFSLLLTDIAIKDSAEELVFRLLEQMRYRSFRSILVRLVDTVSSDETPPSAVERQAVQKIEAASQSLKGRFTNASREKLRQAYADYEDIVLRSALADDHYRLATETRPIELKALQAQMSEQEALLEYVLTGEQSFALVISRQGIESVVLAAETSQLESKVKLFRDRIFKGSGNDWQPLAAELGRLLVEPLERASALDGIRQLTIVPMGFLHDLPFAALTDSMSRLLIERYTMSLAPSATLWSTASSLESSSHEKPQNGSIAFGLRQASTSELPPLGLAEDEAEAVAQALNGQAHLGTEATETALKTLAPTTRRLHVAAHAQVEKNLPLHSRLLLEPSTEDDGNLTVREILDLKLHAELVTLSACDTAQSHSTGLEVDRLGFVEAFLHAGTQHVVANLLPVSDGASKVFMKVFYEHLKSLAPREALVATQCQLAGTKDSHPRDWAPFVLIGRRQTQL